MYLFVLTVLVETDETDRLFLTVRVSVPVATVLTAWIHPSASVVPIHRNGRGGSQPAKKSPFITMHSASMSISMAPKETLHITRTMAWQPIVDNRDSLSSRSETSQCELFSNHSWEPRVAAGMARKQDDQQQ